MASLTQPGLSSVANSWSSSNDVLTTNIPINIAISKPSNTPTFFDMHVVADELTLDEWLTQLKKDHPSHPCKYISKKNPGPRTPYTRSKRKVDLTDAIMISPSTYKGTWSSSNIGR
ncbi:hypothetical protein HAX54_007186 [Datura stramonium]|uniref:Uncharacterized protein n=1 Tax=Datura stramonium TaxID=4076 RepID=A0ABS8TC95_DATST|nr:hypothetical protein [Datura stramonium]